MRLRQLELGAVDWQRLDSFGDRFVFQTREWLTFLSRAQGATPVVAELRDGATTVGYFTGAATRRYGVPILGSPMPGWTTSFMGFNLERGVSRRAATEALLDFAFVQSRYMHLELRDRGLPLSEVAGLGFEQTPWHGRELDLRRPEEELFAEMKRACRSSIRRAERDGVVIEEADPEGFAEDHYAHVEDVFKKQSLVPPYGPERIRELIRAVYPSGRLLLLRARDPNGTSIASGVFPLMNRSMHFLTSGSLREHQRLRPNEALVWYAIRHGKARGLETCDLGGYMEYKLKYGGTDVYLPFLRKSRSPATARLRDLARIALKKRQRLLGRLQQRSSRGEGTADAE